jgi:hypothetical protein
MDRQFKAKVIVDGLRLELQEREIYTRSISEGMKHTKEIGKLYDFACDGVHMEIESF